MDVSACVDTVTRLAATEPDQLVASSVAPTARGGLAVALRFASGAEFRWRQAPSDESTTTDLEAALRTWMTHPH
ncbi:hypothetical protein [Cryptosporangium sp. NPDC048952]|uniref:hypothetical protein n=1 Tax=Cryptosporangium sp. NPDC048952 TaxID=3363961 RepID=UPI003715D376